jgi:ArsR family transcriptional regulator
MPELYLPELINLCEVEYMTELEQRLKAIGDPVRLKIMRLLPKSDKDCEELFNVSELAEELKMAQPTISHHLNILRNADLVSSRKICREVYYWVNKEQLENIVSDLRQIIE